MAEAPVFKVHLLSDSAGWRIIWLLEELDLRYEVERYDRQPLIAPDELKKVHPLGKSPIVTWEEDGKTITLAESGAICDYIVTTYGKGKLGAPANQKSRYLYFLHYSSGSLMPLVTLYIIFVAAVKQSPFAARMLVRAVTGGINKSYLTPELNKHLTVLEMELVDKDYFLGQELTACDVQLLFPLQGLQVAGVLNDSFPRLTQWLARLKEREAYKATAAKYPEPNMQIFL